MPLSPAFLTALLEGHLSSLHSFLLTDHTLSPEIRGDTLTVYYRGGRLLGLEEVDSNNYIATFNLDYVLEDGDPWCQDWATRLAELPPALNSPEEVSFWLAIVPFAKAIMDHWFAANGGLEREAQQLIVRANNQDGSYARATDYYFCDMERAENCVIVDGENRGLRFDLVGVHWPSTPAERRMTTNRKLVVAEAKYGDGAHANEAGLVDHFRGLQAFVAKPDRVAALKLAMVTSFQQKHRLRLIQCKNSLTSFSKKPAPIVWLIILINHDPESQPLRRELTELTELVDPVNGPLIEVRVATSTFMGYGLWDEGVVNLNDFQNNCNAQICCRD